MKNQEAKFTLGAYRAGGQDAADAAFAAALQQTRDDPELRAWFERARAHDATVAAKLREVAPPAGLREAILAGARAGAITEQAWWKRPTVWAVAASVAVLLTVAGVVRRETGNENTAVAALAEFAMSDLGDAGHRGVATAEGALKTWLVTDGSKLSAGSPMNFAQLQANGCRTLRFGGRDLAEVCFQRNGVTFHLYISPRGTAEGSAAHGEPTMLAQGGRAAASWSDKTFSYVLATTAAVEALRGVL